MKRFLFAGVIGIAILGVSASPASAADPSIHTAEIVHEFGDPPAKGEIACPEGMKVIGGGFELKANPKYYSITMNRPSMNGTGWVVQFIGDGQVEQGTSVGTMYAICQ